MEGTRWTGERKWSYTNRSAESMSSESGRSREWPRKWECTVGWCAKQSAARCPSRGRRPSVRDGNYCTSLNCPPAVPETILSLPLKKSVRPETFAFLLECAVLLCENDSIRHRPPFLDFVKLAQPKGFDCRRRGAIVQSVLGLLLGCCYRRAFQSHYRRGLSDRSTLRTANMGFFFSLPLLTERTE